jgi:RNA polymerase sigma factor (sigma-70 family)
MRFCPAPGPVFLFSPVGGKWASTRVLYAWCAKAVNDRQTAQLDVTAAYERYRAELRSFFSNVAHGKSAHVEDLVHNVYLRLLEYPPPQVLREPQAYLFKLAWSELHRFHHKASREPQVHDHESLDRLGVRDSLRSIGDEPQGGTAEALLARVLGELPPLYGEVFLRFKWDGRSYKQIAAEMALSPRQVKRYVARTLQCLKQAWSQG